MDTKPWYQSKGIIGAITGGVPALVIVLKLIGVDIADLSSDLTSGLLALLGLVGTIVAIVGRVKARTVITATNENKVGGPPRVGLIIIAALLLPAVLLSGCADAPSRPSVLVTKTGQDFHAAIADAFQSYVDIKNGNTDYVYSIQHGLDAYHKGVAIADDIKAIVKAWGDSKVDVATGKQRSLLDRLAQIFNDTSGPPAEKALVMARVAGDIAASN